MSFKEMTEMLDKYYGSSMNDITEIVIENPAMMHLKDKAKENAPVDEEPKGPSLLPDSEETDALLCPTPSGGRQGLSLAEPSDNPWGRPQAALTYPPTWRHSSTS